PALLLGNLPMGPAYAQAKQRTREAGEQLAAVVAMIDSGHFKQAQARIAQALAQPELSESQRRDLQFQRERMRRIRLDFTLDRAQAQAKLRAQIPG
ncbi:transglutaminase domain-containing protein, partial [Lysobacter sp. 2RAB21]